MSTSDPLFGEVISAYSRANAIADGVLHDVTALAAEQGIRYPVAIAAHAWAAAVAWDHGAMQDETGRQWDVLTMAAHALRRAKLLKSCRSSPSTSSRTAQAPRIRSRSPSGSTSAPATTSSRS
jgi:hypothetical protein